MAARPILARWRGRLYNARMSKAIPVTPASLGRLPDVSGDRRCVALLSGGLDSILAVHLMLEQGIGVTALQFMTHFGCDGGMGSSCSHDQTSLARRHGFEIKLCHLGQEYIDMVRNPAHGYGSNMNPCIDCRILMLRWAKDYMRMSGAPFIITGEVLDQRPMSQRRGSMLEIDRQAGLEGLILRPLSAKLLEPTVPETTGLVDRSRLLAIRGRARHEQYELAKKFDITEIPQPAGGCLLTDPGYSARLSDLLAHVPDPAFADLNLLRVGRHFRLSSACKAIVGRNQEENEAIDLAAEPGDVLIDLYGHIGPLTILRGAATAADVARAGGITAAYAKAPRPDPATIRWRAFQRGPMEDKFVTVPLPPRASFEGLRVGDTSAPAPHPVRRVDRIEV